MRSAGKMRVSVHCEVNNILEVSVYTRQGEDVFQLVRGTSQLQDYLQGSAGIEPVQLNETERVPPPEVSKFVEFKVASWLQGVDSWIGDGEEELLGVKQMEVKNLF